MYRLFGLLIISLSLLTASIVLQIAAAVGQGKDFISVCLIVMVFILGVLLLIPNSKSQSEAKLVSDEEIEVELEKLNSNEKNQL